MFVISLLFSVISINCLLSNTGLEAFKCEPLFIITVIPLFPFSSILPTIPEPYESIIATLIGSVLWFIIGAIIGLIIGKIKKK